MEIKYPKSSRIHFFFLSKEHQNWKLVYSMYKDYFSLEIEVIEYPDKSF